MPDKETFPNRLTELRLNPDAIEEIRVFTEQGQYTIPNQDGKRGSLQVYAAITSNDSRITPEAARKGLVAHGMEGFDYGKAREALEIPGDYDVECMIAVGRKGRKEDLPKDLQERETPSTRKHLKDIIMKGKFTKL